MKNRIEKLLDDSYTFWYNLVKENNISDVPLTIYDTRFDQTYPESMADIRMIHDARMVTLFTARGYNDPNIPVDDQIVEEVSGGVFMSREKLYSLIIECELDFEKALECMKFTLRHELGHVIDVLRSCIGITVREWNERASSEKGEEKLIPEMRKNASKENRLKWYLQYSDLPREKKANEAIGITKDDIIQDWSNTVGR